MSYPLPPGGLFPLTTAPTGRTAGGEFPLSSVLVDAIKSLNPTAYWKLDEASGNLADAMSGGYTATVTGSPTYGVAAADPIGRGMTSAGTPMQAVTSGSVPTPSASVSVLAWINTTNATAANRFVVSRVAASQGTWGLFLNSSHAFNVNTYQNDAGISVNATTGVVGAINDGNWHLIGLTMDGTTLTALRDAQNPATTTTLTGTWHKASTAGVYIASRNAAAYFVGSIAHLAYWSDRVITSAEFRWLYAIGKGA